MSYEFWTIFGTYYTIHNVTAIRVRVTQTVINVNYLKFSDESLCKMLEHNINLTQLSLLLRRTTKTAIDCIVSKLKSLEDLRIRGECALLLLLLLLCFNSFNLNHVR